MAREPGIPKGKDPDTVQSPYYGANGVDGGTFYIFPGKGSTPRKTLSDTKPGGKKA